MKGICGLRISMLRSIEIRKPQIPFISAVDAVAHQEPADLHELLIRQLPSPVRWWDAVRALAATGIAQLIECGPGKVLTGLNRRIEKRAGLEFMALEDPPSLEAALTTVKGVANAE
jgi:[acyl-carrier-protein] S-malonyltransferase